MDVDVEGNCSTSHVAPYSLRSVWSNWILLHLSTNRIALGVLVCNSSFSLNISQILINLFRLLEKLIWAKIQDVDEYK